MNLAVLNYAGFKEADAQHVLKVIQRSENKRPSFQQYCNCYAAMASVR